MSTGSCLNWNANFPFESLSFLRYFPPATELKVVQRISPLNPIGSPLLWQTTIHPLPLRFLLILAFPLFYIPYGLFFAGSLSKHLYGLFLLTRDSALIIIAPNSRHFLTYYSPKATDVHNRIIRKREIDRTIYVGTLQWKNFSDPFTVTRTVASWCGEDNPWKSPAGSHFQLPNGLISYDTRSISYIVHSNVI